MNKLANTHRFNVVHQQSVRYVPKQKGGIAWLIWEYRDTHYIYRKGLTLTYTSRTPSVSGVFPPKPQHGCQFLHSKRTSFSPEFENPKALIPVCYNGCEKVRTNWQTHRFNVAHQQRVSHVHRHKRWIVLLKWKYRYTHHIYRKELTLTHKSRTPSVSWVLPPNPSAVFNSYVQSWHLSHQNSKTLKLWYQLV